MLRPDVTTPLVGASGAKGLTRDDTKNFTAHGPAACQCRVKATVHQLPGARRRQVPRCDGCGNPISAGSALCETCASGAALVARIEARRADSLRRQAMGALMRAGG
jgi:hypothetical protein